MNTPPVPKRTSRVDEVLKFRGDSFQDRLDRTVKLEVLVNEERTNRVDSNADNMGSITRVTRRKSLAQKREVAHDKKKAEFAAFSPAIAHCEFARQLTAGGGTLEPSCWPMQCALLFVDISGFTNLCTLLKVDDLQRHINTYFTMLINVIVNHGGDVLRFAGDAVMCSWSVDEEYMQHSIAEDFDEEESDPLRDAAIASCRCALALTNGECRNYEIPEVEGRSLTIHCGIGIGTVSAFRVGGSSRWEFFVAGEAVQEMSEAEHCAEKKETCISDSTFALVKNEFDCKRQKTAWLLESEKFQPMPENSIKLMRKKSIDDSYTGAAVSADKLTEKESADSDISRGIYNDLQPGRKVSRKGAQKAYTFLMQQRLRESHRVKELEGEEATLALRAYVHRVARMAIEQAALSTVRERRDRIFVSFCMVEGLGDALHTGQLDRIQQCFEKAHEIINANGGMLRQFMQDDKGAVIIWSFGLTKQAFLDSPRRSMDTARGVIDVLKKQGLTPRVGVTSGSAYCGLVGSDYRCEYAILGPSVNLAARLMCACEKMNTNLLCNDALCEQMLQMHDASYIFTSRGKHTVKGYDNPVEFFVPEPNNDNDLDMTARMVGRGEELRDLLVDCRSIEEFTARHITGAPAVGKSRLLTALRDELLQENRTVIMCKIGQHDDPLEVWSPIIKEILGDVHYVELLKEGSSIRSSLASHLHELDVVLGAGDQSLENRSLPLECELIREIIIAAAEKKPFVLILDGVEKFTPHSWQILAALEGSLVAQKPPMTLITAARDFYVGADGKISDDAVYYLGQADETQLQGLSPADVSTMLKDALKWDVNERQVTELHDCCHGMPLFLNSIVRTLQRDQDSHQQQTTAIENVITGSKVHEQFVFAQLDELSPQEHMIIKIASAIGPFFDRSVLVNVYPGPSLEVDNALRGSLKDYVQKVEITRKKSGLDAKSMNNPRFRFKDSGVCEIIYKLMLPSQVKRLHAQIADEFVRERTKRKREGFSTDDSIDKLAEHYVKSDHTLKAKHYMVLAGRVSMEKGLYKKAESYFLDCIDTFYPDEDESTAGDGYLLDVLFEIAQLYLRFRAFVWPPHDKVPPNDHPGLSKYAKELLNRGLDEVERLKMEEDQDSDSLMAKEARLRYQLAWAKMLNKEDMQNHPEEVENEFKKAIELQKECGLELMAAESLNGLGEYYCTIKQMMNAREAHDEAIRIRREEFRHMTCTVDIAQSLVSLGKLFVDEQEPRQAAISFVQALEVYKTTVGPFHPKTLPVLRELLKFHKKSKLDSLPLIARIRSIEKRVNPKKKYTELDDTMVYADNFLPWRKKSQNSVEGMDSLNFRTRSFCEHILRGNVDDWLEPLVGVRTTPDDVLDAIITDMYPELMYFVGPTNEPDGSIGSNATILRNQIMGSMRLAVKIIGAASSENPLVQFATKIFHDDEIDTAGMIDQLLIMLAISSLQRIENLVIDATNDVTNEVDGPPPKFSVLFGSNNISFPSLERLSESHKHNLVRTLGYTSCFREFCTGETSARSLEQYALAAKDTDIGRIGASLLLLHDVLHDCYIDFVEGDPETSKIFISMVADGIAAVYPLIDSKISEKPLTIYDAYTSYLELATDDIHDEHKFSRALDRIFCMLYIHPSNKRHEVLSAVEQMKSNEESEMDWRELNAELSLGMMAVEEDIGEHDDSGNVQNCPIELRGSSNILLGIYRTAIDGDQSVSTALAKGFSLLAHLYRRGRQCIREFREWNNEYTISNPYPINCLNVAKVVSVGGADALENFEFDILKKTATGAYVVARSKTEDGDKDVEKGSNAVEKLGQVVGVSSDKQPEVKSVVMICDPGKDHDNEMALVLARSLSKTQPNLRQEPMLLEKVLELDEDGTSESTGAIVDKDRDGLGLIDLKLVVATTQTRCHLAKGSLEVLGMSHVQVGRGSMESNEQTDKKDERVVASVKETKFDYMGKQFDGEGGNLIFEQYQAANPKSLCLLLLTQLTDAKNFIYTNEELFVEKTSRVVIMGGVDADKFEATKNEQNAFLEPDFNATTFKGDSDAAAFVMKKCQERNIQLVILTREAVSAASLNAFIYEELRTTGHPIALRARGEQMQALEGLWGAVSRGKIPNRDRDWFSDTFCGGVLPDGVTENSKIWQHIQSVTIYDALTLLCVHDKLLYTFFEPVKRRINSTSHLIVGLHKGFNGLKDGMKWDMQRFLMDAWRHGLISSLDDANLFKNVEEKQEKADKSEESEFRNRGEPLDRNDIIPSASAQKTLVEIVDEIKQQLGIDKNKALPQVIREAAQTLMIHGEVNAAEGLLAKAHIIAQNIGIKP